jgi:presequence protease
MSDEELQQVIAKTVEFREYQEAEDSPEALATIPSLKLSDLSIEMNDYPTAVTENEANSGVNVTRHEFEFTSGLAYVYLGFDVSMLSFEDASLLLLFTSIMMRAGAGEYDSVELSQIIGLYTGGIDIDVMYTSVKGSNLEENEINDGDFIMTKLVFSGKAFSENIDVLFSLFILILNETHLDDEETILQILEGMIRDTEASIGGYDAFYYARMRIESRYTAERYIEEKLSGISQLTTLKSLLKLGKKDWPSLFSRLAKIRRSILDHPAVRDGSFLDITGDSAVMKMIQPAIERFLEALPGSNSREKVLDFYSQIHPWIIAAKVEMSEKTLLIDEGIIIPTQVSHVGKGGLIYNNGEKSSGSDFVVQNYLSTELFHEIRIIGGAYGGWSSLSEPRFILGLYSYRDPNIINTLDVYDTISDALMAAADEFEDNPEALVSFKISTIGLMDGVALSPGAKGWRAFTDKVKRILKDEKQTVRDQIVNAKASDFREFADRVRQMKDPSIAIISSHVAFDEVTKEGLILRYTELF